MFLDQWISVNLYNLKMAVMKYNILITVQWQIIGINKAPTCQVHVYFSLQKISIRYWEAHEQVHSLAIDKPSPDWYCHIMCMWLLQHERV